MGWGEAWLGGIRGNPEKAKQIDYSSPLPFCIRTRDGKAAVFLRFGSKPDIVLSGLKRTGNQFILKCGGFGKGTRVLFSKLNIRRLPKDTPLDAPVRLPAVGDTGKKPTTQKVKPKREW